MVILKVCESCGKGFQVKPSHSPKRHTCSVECRYKRHSKILKGHRYFGGHQYRKGHPAYGGFEARFKKGMKPWNTGLQKSGMSGKRLSEETKRKIAKANNIPEYIRKRQKALHKKPTRPEKKLIKIMVQNSLPFRYVGDGEEIIGHFNPDFIHARGERKVIEVFGRLFHDPDVSPLNIAWNRQYWGRKAVYGQLGYDCLILWDDELEPENKVVQKLNMFASGG